ncbi:unnamed protein product [Linum tenue]|uniref:Uncharacterized protein n=1 Tax=Linum tenue TaxID=586396 RepID=A0AAV0QVA6_9ROSI|nr:unnamed protein product [Linum tenue]
MELERIGISHRHSRALTAHSRAEAFPPQFFVRAFVLISDIEFGAQVSRVAVLLRDLKSSTYQWMRVSYEEWLNFAEHSLENGIHAIARPVNFVYLFYMEI